MERGERMGEPLKGLERKKKQRKGNVYRGFIDRGKELR